MTSCEFCQNGTQTRVVYTDPNDPGTKTTETTPCVTCRFEAWKAYHNRNVSPAHWAEWDRLNNELEGK